MKASLRVLLARGYFPEGIPQAFDSRSFGAATTRRGLTLPPEFIPDKKGRFRRNSFLANHNLARVGQLRRPLGIPNPVLQYNLAREIVSSRANIARHFLRDPLSVTLPVPDQNNERGLVTAVGPPDRVERTAEARSRGRYLLSADILKFYPSVYTHSLAWALHGKAVAKSRRRDWTLLGNRLDFWVRQSQDQETRGIPIGPDTSLVLAEILLAAVDEELQKQIGTVHGYRAIDDYQLVFPTFSAAEGALTALQGVFDEFDLQLNEEKTGISELPARLDDLWPAHLRQAIIRNSAIRQGRDLLDFFSLAFGLARENPKASVLRYALSRVRGLNIADVNWAIYQNLLFQCAHAEPGTLPHVTSELVRYRAVGADVDQDRVADLVSQIIARHLSLGHGSEVVWALWLAIKLGVTLQQDVTTALPKTSDSLVPLLALYANEKGLLTGVLDVSVWLNLMTPEELWRENWLLSYEANVKKWLPSAGGGDHVSQDPCFAFLKKEKVSFFNGRASPFKVKRWRPRPTIIATAMSPG